MHGTGPNLALGIIFQMSVVRVAFAPNEDWGENCGKYNKSQQSITIELTFSSSREFRLNSKIIHNDLLEVK
jgi:hypothetical protein